MKLRPTTVTPEESRAQQLVAVIGARVHIDIVIPRTDIAAKMRLCSRKEVSEARAAARRTLQQAGFPVDTSAMASLGAGMEWDYELGVRILQKAVRDPANVELELAPIEDWRECDDDQIAALGKLYEDLEAQLDPLGENEAPLSEAEYEAIVDAAKKKLVTVLTSFGSRKLASFAITSVARQSTSPTQTS